MKHRKKKKDQEEILVVEDSPTQSELLKHLLEAQGYGVRMTTDGKQALAALRQHRPALVISDIVMPEMDGCELCRQIKSRPELKNIPVVLVTSLSSPHDVIRGLECGADNFITKPYEEKYLLSRIDYILANRIMRQNQKLGVELEISLGGQKHRITSDRQQILDLLISTYEEAVHINEELKVKKEELTQLAEQLERRVEERTAALVAEIAERKQAEETLRESEERFRRLVDSSPDTIFVQREGKIVFINPSGLKLFAAARHEQIVGKPVLDLVHPDYRDIAQQRILAAKLKGEVAHPLEEQFLRLDGSVVDVEVTGTPFSWQGKRAVQVIARDITPRKQAEQALRDSEERYRRLFDSNPQPMWVYDLGTLRFLAVNEAAEQQYGYLRTEFLSMTIGDIRPSEDLPALTENIAETKGGPERGVWRHRKKDGTLIDVAIASHPLNFLGRSARIVLATDVTEHRLLEQQLRQAQKMEAIGQLAGGISHDFNNLLGIILGQAELLQEHPGPEDKVRKRTGEIVKAGKRAADLTRQLLAFSRKQVITPNILDPNHVVAETGKMLRRLIGEDIALAIVLGEGLWKIRADRSQIEQIVMNLAVNARDAMPKGGKLTIETRNVTLAVEYARRHVGSSPGPHIMLAVSDTGCGMTPDVQTHIFEPFFTTKELGKGTGLGLATVYGIVKQSGGSTWVYSELGKGTTFKIYLPVVEGAAQPTREESGMGAASQGSETVLLAEDEESLRSISTEVLRGYGYTVLEATDGAAALQLAQSHDGAIDLLVTDVVMPGMGGADLARQIRVICPRVKVLFVSGYTDDAIGRHGILEEGVVLLEKPFSPGDLVRKVREVLDA